MQQGRWLIIFGIFSLLLSSAHAAQPLPLSVSLPAAAEAGGTQPQMTHPLVPVGAQKVQLKKEKERKTSVTEDAKILISVKKFKIINLEAFPSLGLTQKKIEAFVESLRQKMIEGKKGLTLLEIHQITQALTLLYRSSGLILAQVVIPPQKVGRDGVMNLRLQIGRLGAVNVEGNKIFSSSLLSWPFQNMLSKPLQAKDLESGLLTISSYPGYNGYGVLMKGKEPGTTDLVIKTEKEHRFAFTLGEDDNGSLYTGRNHHIAQATIYNLLGGADQLSGMWIQNWRPSRGHYGGASYSRRVFNPNLELGMAYSRNKYSLGQQYKNLKFMGISNVGNLYLNQTWIRRRQGEFATKITFVREQAKTEYSGAPYRRDNLSVARIGAEGGYLWSSIRGYGHAAVEFSRGFNHFLGAMKGHFDNTSVLPPSRQGASGKYAVGQFSKVTGNLSYLQGLFAGESLFLELEGQTSKNLLISLEQFSLGGVNSVRAFPVSEYLMDKGVYGQIKWITPIPFLRNKTAFMGYNWGQIVHFSLFAEQARGWLNDALQSQQSFVSISGYGAGAEVSLPSHFFFQVQWAKPFGFSRLKPSDNKSSRVWFGLFYTLLI